MFSFLGLLLFLARGATLGMPRTRYKGERPAGETISQRRTADEIAHPDEKAFADQITALGANQLVSLRNTLKL